MLLRRILTFLIAALVGAAAFLGWLGEGDVERSLAPVRTAVRAVLP